jgi:hypothetical protein
LEPRNEGSRDVDQDSASLRQEGKEMEGGLLFRKRRRMKRKLNGLFEVVVSYGS